MKEQSYFDRLLNIHDETDSGVWMRSTRALRQLIGVLGMALPLILVIFSPECERQPLESISHYYYTRAGDFFTVILSMIGVFLLFYTRGFWLSTVAGISILLVVFFPTSPLNSSCSIVEIPVNVVRQNFHFASAAVFLVILALMTIFYFPRQDAEDRVMGHEVPYKRLYVGAGIIMLLALSVLGFRVLCALYLTEMDAWAAFHDHYNLTFWMETVALEAFGFAWLVRGRSTIKFSVYRSYLQNLSAEE